MRTLTAVTMAMMITSAATAAEGRYFSDSATYVRVGASNAARAYSAALASTNTGVVESALAHVAMIALTMPDSNMSTVKPRVAAIETRGFTKEVRYKAWVVRSLMDNPKLFAGMARSGYGDADALFAALAGRMAEHYANR
jgi:hypothetical protein